jgi:hypothetical protein
LDLQPTNVNKLFFYIYIKRVSRGLSCCFHKKTSVNKLKLFSFSLYNYLLHLLFIEPFKTNTSGLHTQSRIWKFTLGTSRPNMSNRKYDIRHTSTIVCFTVCPVHRSLLNHLKQTNTSKLMFFDK